MSDRGEFLLNVEINLDKVRDKVMDNGLGASYQYDVLILDADYKQSLACARSLGRAGLRVALGASSAQCSPSPRLPAFSSRYSARNVVLPSNAGDGAEFAAAVVKFVNDNPTNVVLPTGDASIAALIPYRKELAELGCTLALAPDSALEIANDKDRTLQVARDLRIDRPRSMRIDSIGDLTQVLAEFDFPFVLKPTISWTGQVPDRIAPVDVIDEAEAFDATQRFLAAGSAVLAQEWASGRREGVTLFIDRGKVLASCGHVACRTSPPLGGTSVMRQSIQTPPDTYSAAVRLVNAIGMEGVCEVEFRRDADNRPLLMEINPRLAGTLENAIQSGVDFPLMIWQWATGLTIGCVETHRIGVRTRWLRGDMYWLSHNWRRVDRPDTVSRVRALWTFCAEFARTRHYDYLDWRDIRPAVAEVRSMATLMSRKRR
jgi:predicted ATP-grasp superfamily ATP-dependent carboligase